MFLFFPVPLGTLSNIDGIDIKKIKERTADGRLFRPAMVIKFL